MIRGVLLDVGGVLLIPDGNVVSRALAVAAVDHEPRYASAHFAGVAAIDDRGGTDDDLGVYLGTYVAALRATEPDRAVAALRPVWDQPSISLWRTVVDGAIAGLEALAERSVRLGIVSNSDGTVEQQLLESGICQVGEGDGVLSRRSSTRRSSESLSRTRGSSRWRWTQSV